MSYSRKFWLYAVFAFGAAAIVGVIIGKTVPVSGGVENPTLVLPLLLGLVAALFVPTVLWWRNTDDLQQQGQMVSWWWGGSAGALVMLVCVVVMTGRHSELSLGATYMFLAQFAGMLVVWIGWKIRGRGLTE